MPNANELEAFFSRLPSEKEREYEKNIAKLAERCISKTDLDSLHSLIDCKSKFAYEAFVCLLTIYRRNKDFEKIIADQIARVEKMKSSMSFTDFAAADKITIGLIDGDGIGPVILKTAKNVLNVLLADEIASGKIVLKEIPGLTLENRIEKMQAVPDDVLAAIKECDVLLKGPTTTPSKNSGLPNIESANVTLRRELDLFANVRPVSIPEKNIDWIFYRENTEGEYALGSRGIDITDEISMDFKVACIFSIYT